MDTVLAIGFTPVRGGPDLPIRTVLLRPRRDSLHPVLAQNPECRLCAAVGARARRSNMSLRRSLTRSCRTGRYYGTARTLSSAIAPFRDIFGQWRMQYCTTHILGVFCRCFRSCRKSGLGYRLRILGIFAGGDCNVEQLRSHCQGALETTKKAPIQPLKPLPPKQT